MERIPPHVLLGAYAEGVFPMAGEGGIHWFTPRMRGIIPLDDRYHIPRGLRKNLKKSPYEVRVSTAFRKVMEGCCEHRETWIDEVIIDSYCELHKLGFGYSFECWDDGGLQGGLYGVAIEKAFFGESMFSRKTETSKIALAYLVEWLRLNEFTLLDTQWMTDHLRQFGGIEIPREEYLQLLSAALTEGDGGQSQLQKP